MSDVQQLETQELDDLVTLVASKLPFAVELEADMGGTFVLQIELGRRGGPNDEPDRVTIDPGAGEKWFLDVEGGRESIESPFDRHADPADVAKWITAEATRWGSPAAVAAPTTSAAEKLESLKQRHQDALGRPVSDSPEPVAPNVAGPTR